MNDLGTVPDRSAAVFKTEFFNELGSPVTPLTATWTLTDGNGNTVNLRSKVVITPAPTVYIATEGLDNAYSEDGARLDNTRHLVIKSTYLSSLIGAALPSNRGFRYMIADLPGVPGVPEV